MKRYILVSIFLITTIISASAQIIKGKVLDDRGEPLAGATILIKGTNKATSTDANGKFRIKDLSKGELTLIVKMIGYEENHNTVHVNKQSEIYVDFILAPNTHLNEVEVFGERHKQPEKLDAITRMPLRPSEQIQSISVISNKVIAEQGALTITDAVRNVPGVTLFGSYGGVRESLSTRGYRGVPILKNGVRVDSDFRTGALASDMQGVESVQVIKGSAAITQGIGNDLGSPGGVINVVTKTPKFENSGEVSFRTGSWGQVRPTFDVQSVLDKNRTIAFRLNGAYERNDGFRKYVTTDRVYINPSLEWRPDEKTTVTLELDYLNEDKTPDVGTVNLTDMGTEALYDTPRDKFYGFRTDNVNNKTMTYAARITRQIADKLSVRAAYFNSSYNVDNISSSLSTFKNKTTGTVNYEERQRKLTRSLRDDKNSTFQLDLIGRDVYTGKIKHTFQVGFDYKKTDLTTTAYNALIIDTINVLNPINNELPEKIGNLSAESPLHSEASSYGIMLQEVMTVNQYVKAILGLRYSHQNSTDDSSTGKTSDNAWNPMAGVMITPIKNMNLFGSYTTTTSLRSAANKMANGEEIGASKSRQWETGIKSDWLDNRLRFNFTYFNILNENLSNKEYEPGTNIWTNYYIKAGDLKRQGVEVELSGRILPNLQVMLGYAYLDAKYTNSPSYEEGSAPMNAPEHTANGWVYYTLDKSVLKGLSFGAGVYYVGKRPVNEFSLTPDDHGSPIGVKPFDMPAYTTVNAQVAYTYKNLTASVFFNNILDELGYNSYFRGGYINRIEPCNFAGVLAYRF